MFHQVDNLFFQRMENGDVRVLKLRSAPATFPEPTEIFPAHEVQLDVVIPNSHWCSIIATVSKTGEAFYNPVTKQHRFYDAQDFHNGEPA